MEANHPLTFSEFNSEFLCCLQIQDWKLVNNRPLSTLLRDSPELFISYLMEMLSRTSNQIMFININNII